MQNAYVIEFDSLVSKGLTRFEALNVILKRIPESARSEWIGALNAILKHMEASAK